MDMTHELNFSAPRGAVAEGDIEDGLQELSALIYGERK